MRNWESCEGRVDPPLLQLSCLCVERGWVSRLSPLTSCNKDRAVPGHCFCPFLPHLLYWPQCLSSPGYVALWSSLIMEQRWGRAAWEHKGLGRTRPRGDRTLLGHPAEGAHKDQQCTRRKNSQPPSRTSFQPCTSLSIFLQSFCFPQRYGTILKVSILWLHPLTSTFPHLLIYI